jgi:hypothetical protein
VALGYDCCSLGQCVKDLAEKPGVAKNSLDYVQALQDILNNPSHIYNYPQYYYLCSIPTNLPTSPVDPVNPLNEAANRLRNLTDLYNCTNKIEGEAGICTKTISNAIVGVTYNAAVDDRNFKGTYTNMASSSYTPTEKADLINIQEISFGEVTLFNYDQIANESTPRPDPFVVSSYLTLNGHHNDDSATGTSVLLTAEPSNAISNDLVIRYRTDASCIKVNNSLAKCEKYYIQGQQKSGDTVVLNRRGRVTDHYPATNSFLLPYYANTSKNISVTVDGITQREDIDWSLNVSSSPSIDFISSSGGLIVFDTQKVKITFFVDLSIHHVMDSKLEALTKIQTNCHCADLNCGLAPIKNAAGTITDYACVYPDPAPVVAPISQKIYLSSKSVPVRFFDATGVSKSTISSDTSAQEGVAFLYRNSNLLNPNNAPDITNPVAGEDNFIGFNEIYGSLSYASNSAKPAKEVSINKGKIYDIYVDSGSYSNCLQCGNDYYSQLNKLFPLTQFAGGLVPLQSRTDRSLSGGIRADDMSFGRACFVPATMLPFSHAIASTAQEQRLNRMRAQHFQYANGYQHDWYGFDYGAVIGSFDGVKWFAIGSNRRIKADSNKLFIAVNGPFGDLALESTFTVTINDGSLNPIGSNMVTSDLESDGAQCQKFHQCSTDNDCATTLGWDYACANVNEITTSWPKFDDNAKEIPDSARDDNNLTHILGMSTTGKRCVYRGRGAACTPNYKSYDLQTLINSNSTFNQTTVQSFHTCSANNYCQTISTGSSFNQKFNNRIARYGKVRTDSTSDSFGLGAKIIGRPMEFNAVESIRAETAMNINSNKIKGLCIPGRNPEATSFVLQNSTTPPEKYSGDKTLGMGMSYESTTTSATPNYLASCGIMNDTKNYFYTSDDDPAQTNSSNTALKNNSGAQAISTNAMKKFESIFNNKGISFGLYKTIGAGVSSSQSFSANRCMRAPGASCFSDLDCAPSKVIADKMKMINAEDSFVTAVLNKYEFKFWQEELVCSQETAKSSSSYSPTNNRCCREVGKTISLPSASSENLLKMDKIPGIDIEMSDPRRYSRVATVYKEQKEDWINFPKLSVAKTDQCTNLNYTNAVGCFYTGFLTNQFKTFSAYAEKTSCSGDWIRNFDNGNHRWDSSRFQTFNPLMFRCMNWLPGNNGGVQWSCEGLDQDSPECALAQTSPNSGKAKGVYNFLGKLELMGIPQIAIESQIYFSGTSAGDLSCLSNPTNQDNQAYPGGENADGSSTYTYPTQIYSTTPNPREYYDTAVNMQLYSAGDSTNFQSMKKIFKADEVASCLPAGTTMTAGANPDLCCTGFINGQNNKCQLPDFVDLSIYTNRYVSSEARKLNINLFDQNGYIKEPYYVAQLACAKSMCASNKIALGILVSELKIPGQESLETKKYRFMQGSNASDDANGLLDLYKKGLKINTHAYCLPSNVSGGESGDVTIITCGGP